MSIDASVGGTASDSFVSIDDANAYFGDRLWVDTWLDEDLLPKEKALKWSSQILDRLHWVGDKADSTQALRWPRSGVLDLDGNSIPEDVIPQFLTQATCELALVLIAGDTTADNSAEQLAELKVGPINLKFNSEYEASAFPDIVKDIVSPYSKSFDFEGEMQSMKIGRA